MTKFERVLSDEYIDAIVLSSPITMGKSLNRSKDFILMIEQAVLAKLSEREPLAWYVNNDITFDQQTADSWKKNLFIVKPLYENPSPSIVRDKTACVPENHIPDTSKMVFDPDAALTLAERTLNIEITEPLADEIVQFTRKLHEKYTQEDHIPDAGEMMPEGWQLVPKEPSRDMLKKMFYEIFGMDGIEEEYLAARYRNMLSSFPKYAGDDND